jgi:class 3 adenylate cyclase
MRCTNCEFENPAGMKFCGKCRTALGLICPTCSFENPAEFDFCGQCASALHRDTRITKSESDPVSPTVIERVVADEPFPTVEGERKTVTALFADIENSTSLIENLDPDDARAIIDPALKLMIDVVRGYDGYVVQATGDGIFALFGAPIAHEDHAQRAVHTALKIQAALNEYGTRLHPINAKPIAARIGLNSGEVVVRTIQSSHHSEYLPVGLTSHLAARIQTVTPTGAVGIGETTRKLVEGFFQLAPLGSFQLKGLREPVSIYLATGVGPLRTRFEVAAHRGLTLLVGRDSEMSQLRNAAADVIGGNGKIVAVVGEAGTGKSRLAHEFKAGLPAECRVLEASSTSHTRATAFQPVVDILQEYFEIGPIEAAEKRRQKVNEVAATLDPALSEILPYLFAVLGIQDTPDPLAHMDSGIRQRRTLEALRSLLLHQGVGQPLVVILEDLQWLDPDSEAFLNVLAESIVSARILLLVNYRPEYRHSWSNRSHYIQIRLGPLREENSLEMITALVGESPELGPLKQLVVDRSEGNPLFIEEIVHSLFEQGSLVGRPEPRLGKPLVEIKVPSSVHDILASRIDRLPLVQKELLQMLAVVGRKASLGIILKAYIESAEAVKQLIGNLQASEFIYESRSANGTDYTFKHTLTQEVAYNSLVAERRKLLHGRIGAAMEQLYVGHLDDHLAEVARHYRYSGNRGKALEYLRRAGARAVRRAAPQEAIELLESAMQLTTGIEDEKERAINELALRIPLNAAIMLRRGYAAPELEKSINRTSELARQLDDPRARTSALISAGAFLLVHGELDRARTLVDDLLQAAESQPDLRSAANFYCGDLLLWRGEFITARICFERAIAHHQPETRTFQDPLISSMAALANTLWFLGYPDQAFDMLHRAVKAARQLGHPFTLAMVTSEITGLLTRIGKYAEALESASETIALGVEYGFPVWTAYGTLGRGQVLLAVNRPEEAITEFRQAVHALGAIGTRLCLSGCTLWIAECQMKLFEAGTALTTLAEAKAKIELTGERLYEAELYRLTGEALLLHGPSEEALAERHFNEALEVARRQAAKSWELRGTISLVKLLAKQGRRDEARAMLVDAYNWFSEGTDTADLLHAKALLDELTNLGTGSAS